MIDQFILIFKLTTQDYETAESKYCYNMLCVSMSETTQHNIWRSFKP